MTKDKIKDIKHGYGSKIKVREITKQHKLPEVVIEATKNKPKLIRSMFKR